MAEPITQLDVGQKTDIGMVREQNEDYVFSKTPEAHTAEARLGAVYIVADGIGSLGKGEVASEAGTLAFVKAYYDLSLLDDDIYDRIRNGIDAANDAVRAQAERYNLERIGTTLAGVVVMPDGVVHIFNVGDSRVYLLRGGAIKQLTVDTSAGNMRNAPLTAYIGQPKYPEPILKTINDFRKGDVLLICSDGLFKVVQEVEIQQITRPLKAKDAVDKLVKLARERGAPDNTTVTIIRYGKAKRNLFPLVAILGIVVALVAAVILTLGMGDAEDGETPVAAIITDEASATPTEAALVPVTDAPTEEASATPSTPTDTPTDAPTATDTRSPTPTEDMGAALTATQESRNQLLANMEATNQAAAAQRAETVTAAALTVQETLDAQATANAETEAARIAAITATNQAYLAALSEHNTETAQARVEQSTATESAHQTQVVAGYATSTEQKYETITAVAQGTQRILSATETLSAQGTAVEATHQAVAAQNAPPKTPTPTETPLPPTTTLNPTLITFAPTVTASATVPPTKTPEPEITAEPEATDESTAEPEATAESTAEPEATDEVRITPFPPLEALYLNGTPSLRIFLPETGRAYEPFVDGVDLLLPIPLPMGSQVELRGLVSANAPIPADASPDALYIHANCYPDGQRRACVVDMQTLVEKRDEIPAFGMVGGEVATVIHVLPESQSEMVVLANPGQWLEACVYYSDNADDGWFLVRFRDVNNEVQRGWIDAAFYQALHDPGIATIPSAEAATCPGE